MVALAALLLAWTGAFTSDFGGFEDEPAHLVTALMLRDWLAGLDYADPRGFVEAYYLHYPKVAIGQWPPVLHGSLALWMLVFGTGATAIAAYLSVLFGAVAFVIQQVLRRPLGEPAAAAAGALYLTVPIALGCSQSVMTETPIALLSLLAVLAFGRFLDTGRGRWVLAFAVLAALTLLTKGTGLALGLLPPVALVMARRLDLLRRPVLWVAGLVVGALVAPWYVATLEFSQGTWAGGGSPSLEYARYAAREFGAWLPRLTGWLGCGLVPLGVVWGVRSGRLHGRWVVLAAWLPSLVALHLVVPSSVEERHLSVLAPAWAVFTCLGAGVLARQVARGWDPRWAAAAGVLVVGALHLALGPGLVEKRWTGWGAAARGLLARGDGAPERVLVASDPTGEGLLVAGIALGEEPRPGRVVLRASKVLGNAGWNGRDYEVRFPELDDVRAYLERTGVGAVVVDRSVRGSRHWYGHMDQVLQVLAAGGGWTRVEVRDAVRAGERSPDALETWVRTDWRSLVGDPLTLDDVLRR